MTPEEKAVVCAAQEWATSRWGSTEHMNAESDLARTVRALRASRSPLPSADALQQWSDDRGDVGLTGGELGMAGAYWLRWAADRMADSDARVRNGWYIGPRAGQADTIVRMSEGFAKQLRAWAQELEDR